MVPIVACVQDSQDVTTGRSTSWPFPQRRPTEPILEAHDGCRQRASATPVAWSIGDGRPLTSAVSTARSNRGSRTREALELASVDEPSAICSCIALGGWPLRTQGSRAARRAGSVALLARGWTRDVRPGSGSPSGRCSSQSLRNAGASCAPWCRGKAWAHSRRGRVRP